MYLGEIINHSGVQALYHMESTTDSSSNTYTLTDSGTAAIAGKFNQARDFETSEDDYMYRTSIANLIITGDLSISLWFKAESLPAGGQRFIYLGGDGSSETQANNILCDIRMAGGTGNITVGHEYGSGTNQESTITVSLSSGVMYNLAVVRDATANYYYVYLNGVQVGTYNYTTDADGGSSAQLYIGRAYQTSGGGLPFDGIIDEVCIWNRVISASEIKKRYSLAIGRLL